MGFRDYSPGLNRFLSRDSYNGALADLGLGTDTITGNRYAFTGGNPISRVEHDGHRPICGGGTSGDCGYEGDAWKSNPEKAQQINNERSPAVIGQPPLQASRILPKEEVSLLDDFLDHAGTFFSGGRDVDDYNDLIASMAKRANVDVTLLWAIVARESEKRSNWTFLQLDPLMLRLESLGHDGHSIGMTSLQKDTFERTVDGHPEAFSGDEKWEDLMYDDELAIKVAAAHLLDLQFSLPKNGTQSNYGRYSRESLLAYGYNAGSDRMRTAALGGVMIADATDYVADVEGYMANAQSLYCGAPWSCARQW